MSGKHENLGNSQAGRLLCLFRGTLEMNWWSMIAIIAVAFVICLITTPLLKRAASRWHLVDDAGADPLKIHAAPIPFVGGLGIVAGWLISLIIVGRFDEHSKSAVWILSLGLSATALGFCDDRFNVRPAIRLVVEIAIGWALAVAGIATGLFAGAEAMAVSWGVRGYAMVIFSVIFFVAGAINALNMQDGMDGLAGGVALISCLGFAVVGFASNRFLVVALSLSLAGSLAAFLIYNFHPASVFMGDNGSYFVGFMLAAMALILIFANTGARSLLGGALLIGAPVFDAAFAIARRLARGVSPFAGDRSHFYDYLARRGLSVRRVAFVSYALQACFVSAGAAILTV
jgi:UDP-GlcNAc:undecaprenyl-phosphate GlcNAc-1-phosphate transferase